MKKILSLALAALMLVSALPVAYAADIGFDRSTAITLYGDDVETYDITVPATLQPGDSGTVSVSGKWASNKTLTVSAPDQVTLYYGDQTKTVDITFTDIALVGSDIEGVSTTSTVSVSEASALFGTWSGILNYDIELVEEDAQLINFTIDGTAYQAEEGMTWAQWVNSEYNTVELQLGDIYNADTTINLVTDDGTMAVSTSTGYLVKASDLIEETAYAFSAGGAA